MRKAIEISVFERSRSCRARRRWRRLGSLDVMLQLIEVLFADGLERFSRCWLGRHIDQVLDQETALRKRYLRIICRMTDDLEEDAVDIALQFVRVG